MRNDRLCVWRNVRCGAIRYLLVILLVWLAGCSQDSKLGSVYGIVRLDGKPVTSGTVQFVPAAGRAATGKIESDGTYRLGTYGQSDGALIGTHKVAIIAYEAGDDSRPAYELRNVKRKQLVPTRYLTPGTSGLTFEVKPGENQKDFDLTSQ